MKSNCEKCIIIDNGIKLYYECCCEEDRKTKEKDDMRAKKEGYVEINGRWIKRKK